MEMDIAMMARKAAKALLICAAMLCGCAALGWAGRTDYVDATVSEMKNNGTYNDLAAKHPDATDAELADRYADGER